MESLVTKIIEEYKNLFRKLIEQARKDESVFLYMKNHEL